MKKWLLLLAIVISVGFTACHSVSSLPSTVFVYQNPISASESSVFVGSGLEYATAREAAIKKATAGGYSRIVVETVGINSVSGLVNVSLVVVR
jgi:hypothetical protein